MATQRLVPVFVLSRLDYCNAVLAGLPSSSLAHLQRVLYAAVRLVTGLCPRGPITGTMMELHWLPIEHRVKFKLCLIMHAAVSGQCFLDETGTEQQRMDSMMFHEPEQYLGNERSLWLVHSNGMTYHLTFGTLLIVQHLSWP